MCKRIDLTGNIYNKLTVLRYKKTIKTRAWYECMCFCGNIIDVRSDSLKSGHTKSCGCHKVYALKSKSTNTFKRKHHLYMTAYGILDRCNNELCKDYNNYGGRGIKCHLGNNVQSVIESLLKIDGYHHGLTIDRIDNDKDYILGNLKWSTRKEQANNRRTSITN